MTVNDVTIRNIRNVRNLTIRIATVPCGASHVFMHPFCGSTLAGVAYHDLTIAELVEQAIVVCDGCGACIVPKGVVAVVAAAVAAYEEEEKSLGPVVH
jgi:hypothetical protein